MIPEEMIGKKYNMLEVIALDTERTALKSRKYLVCKCDCGKQKSIRADAIGKIQSCGCIQRQENIVRIVNYTILIKRIMKKFQNTVGM